jgi:hypothetical protein
MGVTMSEMSLIELAKRLPADGRKRVVDALDGSIAELEPVLWQLMGQLAAGGYQAELQRRCDEVDGVDTENPGGSREPVACSRCGKDAPYHRRRVRKLVTGVGELKIQRHEYHCTCGTLLCPADRALGLRENSSISPALEELAADMGASCGSFEEAQELIRRFLGSGPSSRAITRASAQWAYPSARASSKAE